MYAILAVCHSSGGIEFCSQRLVTLYVPFPLSLSKITSSSVRQTLFSLQFCASLESGEFSLLGSSVLESSVLGSVLSASVITMPLDDGPTPPDDGATLKSRWSPTLKADTKGRR